jgi:hypothetical protein
MNRDRSSIGKRQTGVVLIVSLLILLLLAIIATTVSQVSLLQLSMAGNDEAKADALQRSLAAVDAILESSSNTPVVGDLGYTICKKGVTGGDCDVDSIDLSLLTFPPPNLDKYPNYTVTRVPPLETTIPVMDESMASSGTSYRAARFEISATYDDSAEGQGRASVVQGVLVKLAASAQ